MSCSESARKTAREQAVQVRKAGVADLARPLAAVSGAADATQLVRSAMKSQSASMARFASPSGSGASWARASSA